MVNSSSEDESDHQSRYRFEDYSPSADVSESESCGASSFESPVASTSRSTPPLVGGNFFTSYLPVVSPNKPFVLGGKYNRENLTGNVNVLSFRGNYQKLLCFVDKKSIFFIF